VEARGEHTRDIFLLDISAVMEVQIRPYIPCICMYLSVSRCVNGVGERQCAVW